MFGEFQKIIQQSPLRISDLKMGLIQAFISVSYMAGRIRTKMSVHGGGWRSWSAATFVLVPVCFTQQVFSADTNIQIWYYYSFALFFINLAIALSKLNHLTQTSLH